MPKESDILKSYKNKEIWRPIKNYEGLYEISNFGRIKSLDREVKFSAYKKSNFNVRSHTAKLKGKMLKCYISQFGYIRIGLYKDSKIKDMAIHRLVAESFIKNINNKPFINHINGIKTDNRKENLEWVTASENMQHALKLGLVDGRKHPSSKPVKRNDGKIFYSISHAAREMNCCASDISKVCRNIVKHMHGFKFEYVRKRNIKKM